MILPFTEYINLSYLSPSITTAPIYLLIFVSLTMENQTLSLGKPPQETSETIESRKDSIERARFSSEAVLRDSSIKESITKIIGGMFGFLILISSISNIEKDFKLKNKNPWVYSRIILDFTASGALIGYAAKNTLIGLAIGLVFGITMVIIERKMIV